MTTRRDIEMTLIWTAIIVACLSFWAGVGTAVYYWKFHDGAKVVCVESGRGPHGDTFDTGTAITCESR